MRSYEIMIAAIALSMLVGCSQHMPSQGYSVKQAIASQTLNPEAGGTEPVTGLDGKYAAKSMENYQQLPQPADNSESVTLGSLFKVGEGQ